MEAQFINGVTTKDMILSRSCVATKNWCYVLEEKIRNAVAKRVTIGKVLSLVFTNDASTNTIILISL